MTRQETFAAYNIDSNGFIQSLGKFESEMLYAPHFWEMRLDGMADELSYPDGTTIYIVAIDDADRAEYPELPASAVACLLEESAQGFVSCIAVPLAELEAQETDCNDANEATSDDDDDKVE